MTPAHGPDHSDRVLLYALQTLPSDELPAVEAEIAGCADCRRELATLRPIVETFAAWPTDLLRPPASLWGRLARRIGGNTDVAAPSPPPPPWTEPEWAEVAPGIFVKLLATDTDRDRVSMLVRLAPGVHYPAHRHAGDEELHLLDGELMIDDRKLRPGDYVRSRAGTVDERVWSETGCTCVLITSPSDLLR